MGRLIAIAVVVATGCGGDPFVYASSLALSDDAGEQAPMAPPEADSVPSVDAATAPPAEASVPAEAGRPPAPALAPVDAGYDAPPLPEASASALLVRCSAQGTLSGCETLPDGGAVSISGSNVTTVFFPTTAPPVYCGYQEPATMPCAVGTPCEVIVTYSATSVTYSGTCE